jgi:hypothetical protein
MMHLSLELTLTRLGRFERFGGAVSLSGVASVLFAPVSLPWLCVSTDFDCM